MAEWLKAVVLKTIKGESSSRVRIPLPPQWFLFLSTLAVAHTTELCYTVEMRTTQRKGDIAVSQAIATFTSLGADVSLPLTESASYDLIVDINYQLYRVQVKFTSNQQVDLRNIHSNAQGYVIKKTAINTYDWLYVLNKDGSEFLVPECLHNRRSINFFNETYLLKKMFLSTVKIKEN